MSKSRCVGVGVIYSLLLAASAGAAAPRWDFVARLDGTQEQLYLQGCSADAQANLRLQAGADAPRYLRHLRRDAKDLGQGPIDWRAGDCFHAQIDLKAAALADRYGLGRQPGGFLRVAPELWFWRPAKLAADSTIRFELPDAWSVSVPWTPLASGGYRLGATPADWPAQVAFGRFQEQTLRLPGGKLRLAILPLVSEGEIAQLKDWFTATAPVLLASYPHLPLPDTQVLLVPLPGVSEAMPWGQVSRGGNAAVTLFVGAAAGRAGWQSDWTATHELAHLLHPYLGERGRWLGEGLASYYQNVWRARRGELTPSEAWRRLDAGFARGRAQGAGPRLSELSRGRGATMRVYWSGAAFWLEADLALRQVGSSLDKVLDVFRSNYLPSERYVAPSEFISALDAAAPDAQLATLYRRYAQLTEFPDLTSTYARLGLQSGMGLAADAAPQAHRDAIMAVQIGVGGQQTVARNKPDISPQ